MAKNLVIVESPGKTKKIQSFLGNDYKVVASQGHIRDLAKGKEGIDKKNNFQPNYVINDDKKNIVENLKKLVKESEKIYLATDADREGEAISFHLKECLNIPEKKYERIVFHSIEKQAVLEAIENSRKIDMDLVNAQQARRVLDRLVGFDLSPLLWNKIKPGLSAGRVQSVALKLIVEKEKEIRKFTDSSDFKTVGYFKIDDKTTLKSLCDKRQDNNDKARKFIEQFLNKEFYIDKVEKKPGKKSPSPPFTTSTLQQAANRLLGFDVDKTMQIAQKLYEEGHITYMRTDSTILSEEIIKSSTEEIKKLYGNDYHKERQYKSKVKNAQEAHEAIRPTHIENQDIVFENDGKRLYELIWKRTIASQMSDASTEKTTIIIKTKSIDANFISKGEIIKFDGFLKVYNDLENEEEENEENSIIPEVKKGQEVILKELNCFESFKKPSLRYNQASLVKDLEKLGIGRPATYATIISTLQKREYAIIQDIESKEREIYTFLLKENKITEEKRKEKFGSEKSKFVPSDIGILVSDYLNNSFTEVLDYNFTANCENKFDEISNGRKEWSSMISEFYIPFEKKVKEMSLDKQKISERLIGKEPTTGENIYVKYGRFGPCVQCGESKGEIKAKFASLKKEQKVETLSLEEALDLLRWPRVLGEYKKKEIISSIGKYGAFVKYNEKYYSLKDTELPPETISLNQAINIIESKLNNPAENTGKVKEFKNGEVKVLNGKYGPYISYKNKNYKIPTDVDINTITQKECFDIIQNKK